MEVTISLSISRLCEVLMAHSASISRWTGDNTHPLTTESTAMLEVFIDEEVGRLSGELPFIIKGVEPDESGDLRLLSCELGSGVCHRVWRRRIETAICAGVMQRVLNGDSNGCEEAYVQDYAGLVAAMKREALNFTLPGRIARGA